ncbi:MAG: xanthine dehydrogenase family protein subunit M [Gammaproteobacteria bacterium]|nr:xanthine dehydrogenase family protein subunit M [Gammaproteobacteria bacterium]
MKPATFDYVRAESVDQVLVLLERHAGSAKVLAGGQSLNPTLNMRLSAPDLLIDINDLDVLKGIRVDGDMLRIGALVRHAEIEQSELVATHAPLLKKAIGHVAHAAIRNRGTIGGNVSLADPASELPACCVALDASITIQNKQGTRAVRARDYFRDLYETDLQENDLMTSISFPVAGETTVCAFREFVRRKGDFASTGLAVSAELEDGVFTSFSPVFFAVANTPVLAAGVAQRLVDVALTKERIEQAIAAVDDDVDITGDAYMGTEMKRHLAKHYLREVIEELYG